MKIAVIGDPHFANRKLFGKPTETPGVNTRLRAVTDALRNIAGEVYQQVDLVVILGDITHEHGVLTPTVMEEIRFAFDSFIPPVYALSGNHDIDQNGVSIVRAFECDAVVPQYSSAEDYHIFSTTTQYFFIPYMSHDDTMAWFKEMEQVRDEKLNTIVFMHHHFEGAKHGTHEFEPPGGLHPSEIPEWVDFVISGHYHMRQWIGGITGKIMYAGAPLQHDFGESKYEPGYLILDDEPDDDRKFTVDFKNNIMSPRFHIITPEDEIPGNAFTDYYRIDYPADVSPSDFEDLTKELRNVILRPIPLAAEVRTRLGEFLEESTAKGESYSVDDLVEAYAHMHGEEARVEELVEVGKEILNSVK